MSISLTVHPNDHISNCVLQVQEAVWASGRDTAPHLVTRVRYNTSKSSIKAYLKHLRQAAKEAESMAARSRSGSGSQPVDQSPNLASSIARNKSSAVIKV